MCMLVLAAVPAGTIATDTQTRGKVSLYYHPIAYVSIGICRRRTCVVAIPSNDHSSIEHAGRCAAALKEVFPHFGMLVGAGDCFRLQSIVTKNRQSSYRPKATQCSLSWQIRVGLSSAQNIPFGLAPHMASNGFILRSSWNPAMGVSHSPVFISCRPSGHLSRLFRRLYFAIVS